MLQPDVQVTLALSQFFQNDDPGLAWAHAQQTRAGQSGSGQSTSVEVPAVATTDADAQPATA